MRRSETLDLIIGDCHLPVDVAADSLLPPVGDLHFRFVYHGIPVTCHLVDDGVTSELGLQGDIGPMPFSAQSATARAELQMVLDAANSHMGDAFHVENGRISLNGRTAITSPVTAVGLIGAIAVFLLSWKPYLETIAVFLTPPAGGGGDAQLQPGWRNLPLRHRPS